MSRVRSLKDRIYMRAYPARICKDNFAIRFYDNPTGYW